MTRKKILLIIEQCHPEQPSVPYLGYQLYCTLKEIADVTLCTHGRNEAILKKHFPNEPITYIHESSFSTSYYRFMSPLGKIKAMNWPLNHLLFFPLWMEFNHKVAKTFGKRVELGEFDIVHAFTPILPRFPYKIVDYCKKTPFVLGPVNGGLPFPLGFEGRGKKEFSYLNFLREIAQWIPGYKNTYEKARLVISGSKYTYQMLENRFPFLKEKLTLLAENGITPQFLKKITRPTNATMKILFVGRLTPYKGCDLVIKAMRKSQADIELTVVGDGPEMKPLVDLVQKLDLTSKVKFIGEVPVEAVPQHYEATDVFCFPSLREFGGAVVLEAMAASLPCIVVDWGGPGEYVTENSGFKIPPISYDQIIFDVASFLDELAEDPAMRLKMGKAAYQRAQEYTWESKGQKILTLYNKLS